ncbi:MAG: T9SS type A sorting domain-containing protein [Bacteroidota bacterium]
MKKILLILFITSGNLFAQTKITVDVNNVLKTFQESPLGINMNYLVDDDSYLNPATSISQSLSNINVDALRYPGGEKSDNYLWSISPFTSANPHFATQGDCNFPNQDARFSDDFITPVDETLDFDEFMVLANSIDAQPFIVVSGDAHYNDNCTSPPSLADLITNATEWVMYANISNQYNIKYWMIGNESWFSSAYDTATTALQYANDLIQFSSAMKSVDPSIKIVANSDAGPWTDSLIQIAGEHLDVLGFSNYPAFNWVEGYDTYRNGSYSFIEEINSAVTSIGSRAIRIIISEYGPFDLAGAWENNNTLGHALVGFHMFGDQISFEKVDGAYLWNTRWINNDTEPKSGFSALDNEGNLNATGKGLAMWGNHLLDNLVFASNSGFVNSFASTTSTGEDLNIFLINRDYSPHSTEVEISNYLDLTSPEMSISQAKLSGTSHTDENPVISEPTDGLAISENSISLTLSPSSIHVLKISSSMVTTLANRNAQGEIKLFPNPIQDKLKICNLPLEASFIRILTLDGSLLKTFSALGTTRIISVADLPAGLYFLQIAKGDELLKTSKLIKK